MSATGGTRPLTGGSDQAAVDRIRSAGGDVIVSVGGWSGATLREKCSSVAQLAAAYQKVVSAYQLRAIDIAFGTTTTGPDATAYAHIGLTSMNGRTDDSGERVRVADFKTMLAYARQHHIARLTFWSANRDRPCGSGTGGDSCSGVPQQPYDYLKVFTQNTG
jgi:hypothetical protein